MRRPEKALSLTLAALAGAAVGYLYLVHILRPAPAAVACPPGPPGPRCVSYQIIVSPPFFLVAGALVGLWIAYALARPLADRGRRNFTRLEGLVAAAILLALTAWIIGLHPGVEWNWNNGLGWDEVACFFWWRCSLGTLAGLWLAYAVATGLSGSPPRARAGLECAVASAAMTIAIVWALVVGPDQAGQGYVDPFIVAVALAALLRIVIAGWTWRRQTSPVAAG